MAQQDGQDETTRLEMIIADRLQQIGQTVAVAESLTGGTLSSHLASTSAASEWYLGAVVAYTKKIKSSVLGVEPGPVVTATCARQMAIGLAELTGADYALAVTGAGGPGPEEGHPAGTVFIALASPNGVHVEEHLFAGQPDEVVEATIAQALRVLTTAITAST